MDNTFTLEHQITVLLAPSRPDDLTLKPNTRGLVNRCITTITTRITRKNPDIKKPILAYMIGRHYLNNRQLQARVIRLARYPCKALDQIRACVQEDLP